MRLTQKYIEYSRKEQVMWGVKMESRQRYTLWDVYNAARTERHFNYAFWMHITLDILGASIMKYAGYSLVVLASSLVAAISILGFFVVLPMLFKPWSFYMIANSLWGKLSTIGMCTI